MAECKKRVLVTGATGLLGRAVVKAFGDWEVLGLGMSRAKVGQGETRRRRDELTWHRDRCCEWICATARR